ncbi:MAG TPA: cysteine synthase A [Bacteroidales bacterium]|nr:cysteine synthase A [Bacteroidales bacterium]
MKVTNIIETVGNTPHIRTNRLFGSSHEVWVKFEAKNPGGSLKDRIAITMINDAETAGILKEGSVIIEPTSGNTGIGLSMVAAVKGYRIIIVMPESMSVERRKLMTAYGAELELTPASLGMKGAIDRAMYLKTQIRNAWIPSQFDNPSNIKAHKKNTANEIINDFPEGLDYFIAGAGTGGHLSGVGKALRERFPSIKIFAVEPELSPVISGGKHSPHPIQGIGAGFIPANLHKEILNGVITVSKEEAFNYTRRAAREEGFLCGISSGANLAAVAKKIPEIAPESRILTFIYDTGERYLSVEELYY